MNTTTKFNIGDKVILKNFNYYPILPYTRGTIINKQTVYVPSQMFVDVFQIDTDTHIINKVNQEDIELDRELMRDIKINQILC